MKRVVVLGAGISGLSLAWFLKRRFRERIHLTILEKDSCPGGWVKTVHQDGFLFEQGPRSCRAAGAGIETLRLVQQLGIEHDVIGADPSAAKRFLWYKKRLRQLPTGVVSFLTSPLSRGIFAAAARDLLVASSRKDDESIRDFAERRFGRHIADRFFDPMTSGIYAGDISKLSIKSCFPTLHQWEKEHGSVFKGAFKAKRSPRVAMGKFAEDALRAGLFSFKRGMGTLVEELAGRLEPYLEYGKEVIGIRSHPRHIDIALHGGSVIEADLLFSTLPAPGISNIFASLHQELSYLLRQIPCASVAVVNIGYHRRMLNKKGFGYLIPSSEGEKMLGVVWDSSVFPQQNTIPEQTRLTAMLGGEHHAEMFLAMKEEDFAATALDGLHRHLGIEAAPDSVAVQVARCAIPQYLVGHSAKVAAIEKILARIFPRVILHGNSFNGVSLNDCIANSKRLEERTVL